MNKTLTKTAVKSTASKLIKTNGETSTLEVKRHLRTEKYFALQVDVSRFMTELSDEENWDSSSNGTYNVYTAKAVAGVPVVKNAASFAKVCEMLETSHSHLDADLMSSDDDIRFDLGLGDAEIKSVLGEINAEYGIKLDIEETSDYDTISDLCNAIDKEVAKNPNTAKAAAKSVNSIGPAMAVANTASGPQQFYTMKSGKTVVTSKFTGASGNWKVTDTSHSNPLEFDSAYTRDQVRQAYSKLKGIKFHDTRTKKVK